MANMNPQTLRDTVILKTPAGHEVVADLDYEHFSVIDAKVVHGITGVLKPLSSEISDNLARALHARQIYENAVLETRAVEAKLKGFGEATIKLGARHPALEPYWREMAQHRTIARDMGERARHFHDDAMKAIDKILEND